jgi:hypothetical protein
MTVRLSSLVAVLAVSIVFVSTGCSSKAPGTTPKATIQAYENAFNDKDPEAIWGLMSAEAIAKLDEQMAQFRSKPGGLEMTALSAMGITEADLKTMSSKDLFLKTAAWVYRNMEEAEEKTGQRFLLEFNIGESVIQGDGATVTVTQEGNNQLITMKLVKEGDVWKFGANPMESK